MTLEKDNNASLSDFLSMRCFVFLLVSASLGLSSAYAVSSVEAQKERSAALVEWVANDYFPPFPSFSDAEKFYFPIALARLELYGLEDAASNFGDGVSGRPPLRYGILDYRGQNLNGDEALPPFVGKDPFHFILLATSRFFIDAPDAPAMQANRRDFLRAGMDRDDNFSILYGEGTENHIAMTRTAGYIYASEASKEPDLFPEAAGMKQKMRDWMIRWSRELYQAGDAEWNSTIYTAFNLAGWLNVYDYTSPEIEDDPELHKVARAVLDYYALQLAVHFTGSQLGGGEMRGSSRMEAYTGTFSTSPIVAWIWFGYTDGNFPSFSGSSPVNAIFAALSEYRPPAAIRNLAHGKFKDGGYFRLGSPGYMMDRLGETQRSLYIGSDFSLGSASMPVGGWTSGNWQIINWKLLAGADLSVPLMIWGNGGYRSLESATGRNPWDQVAQHKKVLVQMSFVPKNAKSLVAEAEEAVLQWQKDWAEDFHARFPDPDVGGHGENGPVKWLGGDLEHAVRSRIYFPKTLEPVLDAGIVFLDMGSVRVAIRSLYNAAPDRSTPGVIEDCGVSGALSGLLLEVAESQEHRDFEAFRKSIIDETSLTVDSEGVVEYENLAGERLRFEFARSGAYLEPEYDMGFGPREKLTFIQDVEWKQPDWPKGEGHGRVARVFVDEQKIEPLPSGWLIDGPGLKMRDGRMEIRFGRRVYKVDYSDEHPRTRERKRLCIF